MAKWKIYLILLTTLVGGIAAASFTIAPYIPQLPALSGEPFRLGLDLQGGIHLVYEADLTDINNFERDSAMQGLRDVIERRVNLFGVTEPLVQTQGDGDTRRLIVELAGVFDPAKAIDLIGKTPYLEFRELQEIPIGEEGEGSEEEVVIEFIATLLTGKYLDRADLEFGQFNEPIISLQFNKEGAELFEEITARNLQKPLAIYLDEQLLQAPIVQGVIAGGRAQITGQFELEEARQIVRDLNAGALPVRIELISQNSVGPALGTVSLQQSLKAGIAGLVLVMVFMILFYRALGVLASLALVFYIVFLLAILKLILVTFTLAGIAGLILSVGMAVDANILIFSRMREELKEGKRFGIAVQEGFRRA
ncbi:protein translocase subunit SecD, partial [Patescibacteria group bacterium]|nr:protein translocase subunit SecD [Patescibacteria group bacterium]